MGKEHLLAVKINTETFYIKLWKILFLNQTNIQVYIHILRFYLFIFRERGKEGGWEGEKNQCVVASHGPLTGDLACNLGMCPDWESNQQTFGSWAGVQSTEPHQPGLYFLIQYCCKILNYKMIITLVVYCLS